MINDTQRIIDDLLAQWHAWSRGYRAQAGYGTSPMFADTLSSRQWDSEHDVLDKDVGSSTMQAVELAINGDSRGDGAMQDVYRTALQIQARNLFTGRMVWSSPRLPNDLESRAQLLGLARVELMNRLEKVGVI